MARKRFYNPHSRNFRVRNKVEPLYNSWVLQRVVGGLPLKSRARNKKLLWDRLKGLGYRGSAVMLIAALHATRPLAWIRIEIQGPRPAKGSEFRDYKDTGWSSFCLFLTKAAQLWYTSLQA